MILRYRFGRRVVVIFFSNDSLDGDLIATGFITYPLPPDSQFATHRSISMILLIMESRFVR